MKRILSETVLSQRLSALVVESTAEQVVAAILCLSFQSNYLGTGLVKSHTSGSLAEVARAASALFLLCNHHGPIQSRLLRQPVLSVCLGVKSLTHCIFEFISVETFVVIFSWLV